MRRSYLTLEQDVSDIHEYMTVAVNRRGDFYREEIAAIVVTATHHGDGSPSTGELTLMSENGFRVTLDVISGYPNIESRRVSDELLVAARTAWHLAGLPFEKPDHATEE